MVDKIDGKTLCEIFAFVAKCGSEIESLHSTISNKLLTTLSKSEMPCVLASEKEEWDSTSDESGWVLTNGAWSFPLKSRGKGNRNHQMYLIFQVSLVGDGIPTAAAAPVLHISLREGRCDFEQEYYVGFPAEADPDLIIFHECLIAWQLTPDGANWKKFEWTFTVLLLSINSVDDLQTKVIGPALSLLKNGCTDETVMVAFPDELFAQGLVRYKDREAVFGS
ncbi:MAG: hypothetical protein AB7V26_07080 [Lysobacterales bacterium]